MAAIGDGAGTGASHILGRLINLEHCPNRWIGQISSMRNGPRARARTRVGDMTIVDWDREAVKRGLAEGSVLLIDVREADEFARGHIPGSVSHPLSTFDLGALQALIAGDGRRPVLSCAAGVRSARALAYAQSQGVALTEHYAGGFKDWLGAGEAVE